MRPSDVTVIVVPRDHFSDAREALDVLLACTPGLGRLVYVDGGSPRALRKHLERKAAEGVLVHLRSESYLAPQVARNLGLREVRTPLVALVDNDVIVSPGWLDHLLRTAQETGADVVGPTVCECRPLHTTIHHAGGFFEFEQTEGGTLFAERRLVKNTSLEAAKRDLHRMTCDVLEFHCLLVRATVFERVGLPDESLLTSREHVDFCLRLRQCGAKVVFEPAVTVTFLPPGALPLSDLPYFFLRWSDAWEEATESHFRRKWNLLDATPVPPIDRFVRGWRRRAWGRAGRGVRRLLGPRLADPLFAGLERILIARELAPGGWRPPWQLSVRSIRAPRPVAKPRPRRVAH